MLFVSFRTQGLIPGLDDEPTIAKLVSAGITTVGKLLGRYYSGERSKQKFFAWLCGVGVSRGAADLCSQAIDLKLHNA